MKNNKKQVLFIHGGKTFANYEAYFTDLKAAEFDMETAINGKKRWRYTLAEKLGNGFEVILPSMPSGGNAKYDEWKIWFEKIIPFLRDNIILMGHSLGGIFLVKYLSENNFSVKITATYLIAPPYDDNNLDSSLADFVLSDSLKIFEEQGGRIYIYHSEDDPMVLFSDIDKYAKALPNAKKVIFKDRGHFLQEEFPELVKSIKNL